jgi:hypothetical protein
VSRASTCGTKTDKYSILHKLETRQHHETKHCSTLNSEQFESFFFLWVYIIYVSVVREPVDADDKSIRGDQVEEPRSLWERESQY